MDEQNILDRIITSDSFPEYEKFEGANIVNKITVVTKAATTDGTIIEGKGISQTHPDDLDLATEKTGTRIALLRSYIHILAQLEDSLSDEDIQKPVLDRMQQELEAEIQAFIDRKETMYQRIRANRTGDMSNKVRHFALSENGKKSVEVL